MALPAEFVIGLRKPPNAAIFQPTLTSENELEPITQAFAEHFASDWIEAWNAHDLDRILAHYSEDFEMSSPVIVQIAKEPSGRLVGKARVRAYWAHALELLPDLKFELIATLVGVESIALHYRGAKGRLAAEVFFFGSDGKVKKAAAHYGL
jgi:ketosteroid isomerase-like protein